MTMINLEIPRKFSRPRRTRPTRSPTEVFRPISRKYDTAEHEYPKELDMLAAVIDGMNAGGRPRRRRRGRASAPRATPTATPAREPQRLQHGHGCSDSSSSAGATSACCCRCPARDWAGGDRAVANEEQLERFDGKWAAMAITEPEAGSDSAAIRTTAVIGRRRVRPQRREDLRHLGRPRRADRRLGDARSRLRAARRSSRSSSSATTPG